ncbi:hypothetical protein [Magnetovibrio blakemorei]|nr:hypothetical protein [Magnetovibrio blakemorei]
MKVVISPHRFNDVCEWLYRHCDDDREWMFDSNEADALVDENALAPRTWYIDDPVVAQAFANEFEHPYGYIDFPIPK